MWNVRVKGHIVAGGEERPFSAIFGRSNMYVALVEAHNRIRDLVEALKLVNQVDPEATAHVEMEVSQCRS